MKQRVAMLVHPDDNVLCAIENIEQGEQAYVALANEGVTANEFIKQGHKIARREIKKGDPVVKYGTTVGLAKCDIHKGDWVHDHNELDITEELLAAERQRVLGGGGQGMHFTAKPYKQAAPQLSRQTVMGYPRTDGRFGIRNYVIVISLVQCANTAAQKIAQACGDIPAIVVEAACGEFAERFARTKLGFVAAGIHPNVYGVLLVSLGCQQADPEEIRAEIARYGKEVEHLCIQTDGGQTKVIETGIELVKGMQHRAAAQKRVPCPITGLVMGGYTGGSDWTSGLSSNPTVGEALDIHEAVGGIIIDGGGRGGDPNRAASHEVAVQMLEIEKRFNDDCTARSGKGLSEVNPSPGNKAGGLTTLTEKNLGSAKADGHCKVLKIVQTGYIPEGPGCYSVDQPQGANDSYACTTFAMSGAHFVLFTTGCGTGLGNAVMPSVKVTGNPATYERMTEFFDYSAVDVLMGEKTVEQAGLELYEKLLELADGEPTCSEKLHDWSYTIPHGTSYNGDYEKPCER